jgi:hypothetical protein
MLIDVAIPGDRNMIKKEAEKILKYKYCSEHRGWCYHRCHQFVVGRVREPTGATN